MKQCTKCEQWKAFECYYPRNGRLSAECRQCRAAYLKEKRDLEGPKGKKTNRRDFSFNSRIYGVRCVDKLFEDS